VNVVQRRRRPVAVPHHDATRAGADRGAEAVCPAIDTERVPAGAATWAGEPQGCAEPPEPSKEWVKTAEHQEL
jgi:hypothetical protein